MGGVGHCIKEPLIFEPGDFDPLSSLRTTVIQFLFQGSYYSALREWVGLREQSGLEGFIGRHSTRSPVTN